MLSLDRVSFLDMEVQTGPSTPPEPVVEEPTVLDYVKDRLIFWRPPTLYIPDPDKDAALPEVDRSVAEPIPAFLQDTLRVSEPERRPASIPWIVLIALGLALLAQRMFEPPDRDVWIGVGLYAAIAVLTGWSYFRGQWAPPDHREDERQSLSFTVLRDPLIVGLVSAVIAFAAFGTHQFTPLNVLVWLLAIGAVFFALWIPSSQRDSLAQRTKGSLIRDRWVLPVSRWAVVFLITAGVVLFFRLHQLDQVPSEMVSDHAEKLLDVSDVLNGQYNVFFTRNTGREASQFYLTAFIAKAFGTGLSFISLKIGTVLAGLVTLWYVYRIGKEVGNKWVGLLAFAFCGIAYWPNIISRIGLRFPLYPLFFAPTLFYLIRGLRTSNRNDFLLSGLALGLGLHGYTSFRIVPFVVVTAVAIYLLHRQSYGVRKPAVFNLVLLAIVSLLFFLPLLRYSVDNFNDVAFRSLTRISGEEQAIPGPVLLVFLRNVWNAVTMFFWSNGDVWVHSIPYRPALDVVSGALFFCGLVLLMLRYIRRRHWLDLFLIVSIPLLMLPSILSLAFPGENPNLNRTAAAYIPVFVIVALGLDGLLSTLKERLGGGLGITAAWMVGLGLFAISASQNYDLVFNQYQTLYTASAMNTSEAGKVIRGFVDSVGTPDTAWVVAYPYWLDTRLIGINAGFPTRDYAILPENIDQTTADPRTKLFILNMQDTTGQETLKTLYPNGMMTVYPSRVESKDFYVYLVPSSENASP